MMGNQFMREWMIVLILKWNLFRLESSQLLNTFIYISRGKIFIAPMQLSISFFNQRNPKLMYVNASSKYWFSCAFINWNSLVNDYVYPLEVFEESQNIETNLTIFMENRWIYSTWKQLSNFLINNHVLMVFHTSSSSNKEFISSSKHRHCTDEPAIA